MGATYGVSHSGQLKILEVANSLEGLDPNAVSRKKLDELIGFRDWLRYLLLAESHHISAIDELYFLDFFDVHGKVPLQLNYNQLVKKLTNHHLLFSPSSRVRYCFEVYQAYENDSLENSVFEQFISSQPSQQSQRWKRKFKHFKG
ncbi:unnamed protein product [Prunus armeniaca]|uniref:Uncharacterized protein n=1 Tax=Prunus armeniaca TaxID=36596 RepID=A0A6J5V449_PRUAR|nr:unnamed protein product [Prunus armeniaca]CAB4312949.1 unnamed protein product [Prunus armeniaca]